MDRVDSDALLKEVRKALIRLRDETELDLEIDAIDELCDEFSKAVDDLDELDIIRLENEALTREVQELERRLADDDAQEAFRHATKFFSDSDELYAMRSDEGPGGPLLRVGGSPLTIGDLASLLPEVETLPPAGRRGTPR